MRDRRKNKKRKVDIYGKHRRILRKHVGLLPQSPRTRVRGDLRARLGKKFY